MNLLSDILGMHVTYEKWEGVDALPLYMTGIYDYKKAIIDGIPCIIMILKAELSTLPALKKQIKRVQAIEEIPVVIKVSALSAFRRKNMIEAHIPFIIAEEQAYLPFMGTILRAKTRNETDDKKLKYFKYSTQQLFLWYLYQPNQEAYISEAAQVCPFSSMTMTRATRELVATGMMDIIKDGVRKILICKDSKKELYENVRRYLKSPVSFCGYIDVHAINTQMVSAGTTALAERSMLNGDKLKTYAIDKDLFDKQKLIHELVDPDKQIKLELWQYNPVYFTQDGIADPISVALSLENENDERVEMMIEEMLEDLWERIEW